MDIKAIVTDTIEKFTKDEALQADFKKDPVKAVEKVAGVDLPDDAINQVVNGVKAKLSVDKVSGALDSIKKLF